MGKKQAKAGKLLGAEEIDALVAMGRELKEHLWLTQEALRYLALRLHVEQKERERVRARIIVREAAAMAGSGIYRSLAWANRKLGAGIGKSREFVAGKVTGLWSAMVAGWRQRETEAPRWAQGRS
jgi:hypothetical protein